MSEHAIEAARQRIEPYIHRTPLWPSTMLSRLTGRRVYLKAELLQKTGSYKPRGILNRVMELSPGQKSQGVITFSAGNAGQALAYAAAIVGTRATIVMPATASPLKAEATRQYGGEVILHGKPTECFDHCMQIAGERGLLYISSYDDMGLMVGHASMGLEILDELPAVDAIYVPVGGGGMAGGLTLALEARGSTAKLLGAEPEGAPKMARSFDEGRPVALDSVNTVADGLAAPSAGSHCYAVIRNRVEAIRLVSDTAIVDAMKLLMLRAKLYVEPSGAASVAAFLEDVGRTPSGATVVCVISGGNLDLGRLKALLP